MNHEARTDSSQAHHNSISEGASRLFHEATQV
jgi:hypothetical protein